MKSTDITPQPERGIDMLGFMGIDTRPQPIIPLDYCQFYENGTIPENPFIGQSVMSYMGSTELLNKIYIDDEIKV